MVSLIDKVRSAVRPLEDDSDLEPLLQRLGRARVVMIGEASHGTSEFYSWRARITRRLLEDHGFSFVAVEGDWPDCMRLTRFLKGRSDQGAAASDVLRGFTRWPSWMWANHEVAAFSEWLRAFNDASPLEERVGFYGLDVYSLWDSLNEVLRYLEARDGEALEQARRALACFAPYGDDAEAYARAVPFVSEDCRDEVVELSRKVQARSRSALRGEDPEDRLDLEQNARVAQGAEAYYRQLAHGGRSTWNLRDRHMWETLQHLLRHRGPGARAVVWAHNTHVGDARYTDMADGGMFNIGQLAREELGSQQVALVGMGTYGGTVIASTEWAEPLERMVVPPGREGSWEHVFHEACGGDALLLCEGLDAGFYEKRAHRAIGVVYHPAYERLGNYVPTVLPRRYDAFIHLDRTSALRPLHVPARLDHELPQTFPSGQ